MERPTDAQIIESAQSTRGGFVKPQWGLTHAIPDGVALAWGARAIYCWREVSRPVMTPTGRAKLSHGHKVMKSAYEPMIDLVWDRMGWSSLAGAPDDHATRAAYFASITPEEAKINGDRMSAMSEWLNTKGIPAIREQCRALSIQTDSEGPEATIEHESDGYKIVANPNGSCGYLYIAAWKVPQ